MLNQLDKYCYLSKLLCFPLYIFLRCSSESFDIDNFEYRMGLIIVQRMEWIFVVRGDICVIHVIYISIKKSGLYTII